MRRLTCEMCGSTDLIKNDGVFVCQSCGTKYSVEEAKKMMIEGTVEVTGTVKVDNTAAIENYLDMARNAKDAGNNKEADNYCNKIIEMEIEKQISPIRAKLATTNERIGAIEKEFTKDR